VVVVGAGIAGLTTALALRERGLPVEVWTADDPLQTTSAVAGAIWYPYLASPRDRVLLWSRTTFRRLVELARDPATGVRVVPVVEAFATDVPDLWWAPAAGAIERLPAAELPPPYRAAIRLDVPACDVPRHLPWLVARVQAAGASIERRRIDSFAEAFAVADTVVNCTGLGAAGLCCDRELQAVRGQVVVLERQALPHAWIDDTHERPRYVIPRPDDVVVGGTAQIGNHRLEPDDADTRAIVAAVAERFPALGRAAVRAVRVGLRPYRPSVRVEIERPAPGRRLVHNYGHGGAGYTLAWGCAEEVAGLVAG
jgi:D-amino-acid oxidase